MAEGREVFRDYKGFVIRVLAMAEYSPHPPNVPYSYTGYVARPGADIRIASKRVLFSHAEADFLTSAAAEEAGFAEGCSIVDGTHADQLNVKGL